jgi:hypothetical protein
MSKHVSVGTMIERVAGMADTDDLNDWENEFVNSINSRYKAAGKKTEWASEKQLEVLERIYNKHFA